MEDHKIVELYWERSQQAIEATDIQYGRYCRTIARNILEDWGWTEETVSDTYMAAWNSMPPHRPSILRTFLGKITRRLSLKRYRDEHREKRGGGQTALALEELEECIAAPETVEEQVIRQELEQAVRRFVEQLPSTQRQIFLRRYWFMEPISDISRDFHFSESKVRSMLYRTRQKLKAFLKEEGIQ